MFGRWAGGEHPAQRPGASFVAECEHGEANTLRHYEQALTKPLPDPVRGVVERHRAAVAKALLGTSQFGAGVESELESAKAGEPVPPEAIIFVGIQGSGKTTFYRERFLGTHVRISLDLLRTRHRERVFLTACLTTGQPFVVDNTNMRAAQRAAYIAAARSAGFRVIGYFFDTPLKEALRRNAQRAGKAAIPVPAVAGTLKRLEPPRMEEGFDELHRIEAAEEAAG